MLFKRYIRNLFIFQKACNLFDENVIHFRVEQNDSLEYNRKITLLTKQKGIKSFKSKIVMTKNINIYK